MTVRRGLPLLALVVAVAALAVLFVVGPGEARIGAAFACLGIGGGLASVVRAQRVEHADDAVAPSTAALLTESMAGAGMVVVGVAIYMVAVVVDMVATETPARDASSWADAALAGTAFVGTAIFLTGSILSIRRREGVERQQLVEATSVAFFVIMLAALGYATFEAFADAPTISMWAVWGLGGMSWAITSVVLQRRTS